jgi:hypothetical protein
MVDVLGPDLWVHGHLHNRSDFMGGAHAGIATPGDIPASQATRTSTPHSLSRSDGSGC